MSQLLALFKYEMFSCLVMAVEQESKFVLNLSVAESYIYGTAITSDNSYSINIQQPNNNLVVLPSDFLDIKESTEALVSFDLPVDSNNNDNNKKISISSQVKVGQGDLIEVYVNQDDILLTLANNLPVEMTLAYNIVNIDITKVDR